jgi:hypothetical protein
MSITKSLWPASAIWVLAVFAVGLALGVSSWGGGMTLVIAAAVPILVAHHFWSAREQSLSEEIQRELR